MRLQGDFRPALVGLHSIQLEFRRGILQKALNTAIKPVVREVKKNARKIPKDSGRLAKGMAARSSKSRQIFTRAWVGIGPINEQVAVERTGWRGRKYTRYVNVSRYAHLKEHGGSFGRFAKKAQVRGYPLFAQAWRARGAQFAEGFVTALRKGVSEAWLKGRSTVAAQLRGKGGGR